MPVTEQDFELSLLAEEDLAGDPYPGQVLRLDVICVDATAEGGGLEHLSIRTTPQQLDRLIERYRALRYSLMQRARAQAEQDHAAQAAFGQPEPEPAADPRADLELLDRVRRGLEAEL